MGNGHEGEAVLYRGMSILCRDGEIEDITITHGSEDFFAWLDEAVPGIEVVAEEETLGGMLRATLQDDPGFLVAYREQVLGA